ncbi:hypothetical protein [Streptomyces galbus]|nr:hypothetical protein [Streptomyces galbus]GHD54784.1 hypothetical protein GCM10010335_69630 [Streptomyces galbus]
MPNGTDHLFTVERSLQIFADDIGEARSTVEDWRWTASHWPEAKLKDGVQPCTAQMARHDRATLQGQPPPPQ